ncbi:MAG: aminopeptidase P family protein [Clostridia bacterium]|nr:aminopeptidase P family protein [Clostridia bacterium]
MRNISIKRHFGVLISDNINRNYFSNADISEGFVLLTSSPVYFTDARYFYGVKDKIKAPFTLKLYNGLDSIKQELKAQSITNLYIDYDNTTITGFNQYKKLQVNLLDGTDLIKKARRIKDAFELKSIKKACEITQIAYEYAIKKVKKGITENALKSILEDKMIKLGATSTSFETIVAFGANSAVPHHETGDTKLKKGDIILIDCGCKVNGYCSDMTRTCVYGKASDKIVNVYNAVLKANLKAEKGIKPDMLLADCDNIAREYLAKKKLGEYFTHSLGHGVGLEIHEAPTLSKKAVGKISEGEVFTIEPGVYIDGEFGVRIEDTVVIKNGKVKRLFNDDKKLKII